MTNTLIIYAHPETKGHCSAILEEVTANLKQKSADFEVIDLYKIKYDPILHEEELYTSENHNVSKENKIFQEKISAAEHLIFIYPVWWADMPAILKGFFDRILTSGFAYKYVNGMPKGLLNGKTATAFITSGAPAFVIKFFLGNRPAKIIRQDIMKFCGIKAKVVQIGRCTKLDDKKAAEIRNIVRKILD
jgi:NAD(P)H dehydrogenase (quinone)